MSNSADIKILPFRGAVSDEGVITAKMSRTFTGGVTLEMGLSYTVSFDSEEELSDIFADAFVTLNTEMRVQVAKLAQAGAQSSPSPNGGARADDTLDDNGNVVIDVTSIAVEQKGDKRIYKARGGRFEKYGVRLWMDSDVIGDELKAQIERATPDSDGNLKMVNVRASIKMHEGKPTKVARIWRMD